MTGRMIHGELLVASSGPCGVASAPTRRSEPMRTTHTPPPRHRSAPLQRTTTVRSPLSWALIGLALAGASGGCSRVVVLTPESPRRATADTLTLGSAVGGDTTDGSQAFVPPCGAVEGTPERRFTFVAPESGRFVVRTESQYDAVIAVYVQGSTEPLDCNDDDGSTARSRVNFDAVAGQTYDVVVDGYAQHRGAFSVRVDREADVSSAGAGGPGTLRLDSPVTGTTIGAGDHRILSCAASQPGTPDESFTFVPPESGTYVFRTQTDYDGALEVLDGVSSLGCNDDDGTTRASRVTANLQAGRTYTVVVDGFSTSQGQFTLVVSRLGGAGGSQVAGGPLTLGSPVAGSTVGGADAYLLPCGAGQPGNPDAMHPFVPPEDGVYTFATRTDYDGTLALFDGTTVLACNDDDGSTRASRITTNLVAGRTYQVVVDGFSNGSGHYELAVTRMAPRTQTAITLGQPATGSTAGGSDSRTPPCGSTPGSSDEVWTFVAPRTATYRARIEADYDSVLAIYPAGAPDPLLCNDDTGDTRTSEVEGSLIGGQRYEVVVDGYGDSAGNYRLLLEMLSGVGGTTVTPPSNILPSSQGGPLPENLRGMAARCAAAQAISTGRFTGMIEPTDALAQISCGAGGAGGDLVYTLTLASPAEVYFHAAADFELGLEVRATCSSRIERCVALPASSGGDLTLTLAAGTYTVVLDAMDAGSRGPVHLDVNVRSSAGGTPQRALPME